MRAFIKTLCPFVSVALLASSPIQKTNLREEKKSDKKRGKISLCVYYLPIDHAIFLVEIIFHNLFDP